MGEEDWSKAVAAVRVWRKAARVWLLSLGFRFRVFVGLGLG